MFNFQILKCIKDVKSVSSTHAFTKNETYKFAVIQHSDGEYECVLKFPDLNGELVDLRYFEDYDSNFIYEPYCEVIKITTLSKLDNKNRPIVYNDIICGGSLKECNEFCEINNFTLINNECKFTDNDRQILITLNNYEDVDD